MKWGLAKSEACSRPYAISRPAMSRIVEVDHTMDTALNYTSQADKQTAVLGSEPQTAVALAPTDRTPTLSIILPTRNEAGNIHLLLTRIEGATRGIATQVVFVDDSTD